MASAPFNRPTALDFATRNVHGDTLTDHERAECVSVIRDLCAEFGARYIADLALSFAPAGTVETTAEPSIPVVQALRALCQLIAESDRPQLTAALVARLVGLETGACRRHASFAKLGAENGISKQAVSNRMKIYALRLGLPRPDSTEKNRRAHHLMNRRNYAR